MGTQIIESTAELKRSGSKWKAVLITPGQGSSGSYSEDMLRSTGPAAFPKGTHSYIDHKPLEQRSPKDLFGVLAEDAHYEDGVGLVGTLQVMPHYKEFADAVAGHAALSISAQATRTDDGVIESIIPDRTNTVDLVSYAGREGSGLAEQLLESARESFDTKTSVTETDSGVSRINNGKEKISMDEITALAARVDAITEGLTKLSLLVTPLAESLAADQEKARLEALESEKTPELDFSLIAEAAIAAGLPKASREVVYTEVRLGGASVEESIAKQKAFVEQIQESVQKQFGAMPRIGTDSINQDFSVSRWGN